MQVSVALGQVELPKANPTDPIVVSSQRASRWTEGHYTMILEDELPPGAATE